MIKLNNNHRLGSYNCFYSAVYYLLEKYYSEDTQLIMNNRWQFFYKPGSFYSDDKRILGEYPMLYDIEHLAKLSRLLNIDISFQKPQDGTKELHNSFEKKGYIILFVNRFCYDNRIHLPGRKCVTTFMIDDYEEKRSHYKTFDEDLACEGWIENEILYHSWKNASDYETLNSVQVHIDTSRLRCDQLVIKQNFCENLADSLCKYLKQGNSEQYIFGNEAFYCFADDIVSWSKEYNKLIDCSMYINIIVRQRKYLLHAMAYLKKVYQFRYFREEQLVNIIELWDKLKMLMYIMGMRRQSSEVSYLKKLITEIQHKEYQYAEYLYFSI